MKKLPLGIQSFEKLRTSDFLYVDKTEFIYRLISEGRNYLLSRPRLFGKSLLVSTLDALFRGRKELFEGLYIYDKWDWSQQHPVIKIDWTRMGYSTLGEMQNSIVSYFKEVAQTYQVTLESPRGGIDGLRELIRGLHDRTGQNVVVLIDDYDKPITDHLFDSNLETIHKSVHDIYRVLKGADQYLEFVFITGISNFVGLSIFSSWNNSIDITLGDQFSAICGYTQEELESNFSEHIDSAAEYLEMSRGELLEYIRYWYNGYTWDGTTSVYNPFTLMPFFDTQEFSNYWFHTGTPTLLLDMIKRCNDPNMVVENIVASDFTFKDYDPLNISILPLLFQTGYLTIKQRELVDFVYDYTLGMPNMEVTRAFMMCFLEAFGQYTKQVIANLHIKLEDQIIACDEAGAAQTLNSMIASIPSELEDKTNGDYYQNLMLMWIRMLGFEIKSEVSNNIGRADAVWVQPGFTVVAEIKFDNKKAINTLLNAAMKQIHDRQDYNRYHGKILLLAIAFSGKQAGCKMELLPQTITQTSETNTSNENK
jgi:hypothetical protein